jgi:DNA replication and repair protein RecF
MAPHTRARVSSLSLRDFRGFEKLDLSTPAGGFVLIGENGAGKTNLLESIHYLSLLRSPRGARDIDIVRFGAAGFFIEAEVDVGKPHQVSVGFERAGRRKRVRRDGCASERLSDALGALPTVMFSPDDVGLVSGAPSARRRFLDIMLALSSRPYLHALQQYRAALERRNAALRDAARVGGGTSGIEAWEPALAEQGAVLWRARREWVERVAATYAERCGLIGERGSAELRYDPSVEQDGDERDALARALVAGRKSDLRFGMTRSGPHRDDLVLHLDGRDLRTFGSAGQQRTAAITLRTLEAETLRDSRSAAPVFLLDDPFAELDAKRAERVLALLSDVGLGQTILAVPRDTDIPRELTSLPRARVSPGSVRPEWSP